MMARAERERYLATTPEAGAARAAARLVAALRDVGMTDSEVQIAASALLELLHETSAEVRVVLAAEIGNLQNAPQELVERLAHDDDPAVAEGVILGSPVLDDAALLKIIRQKTRGHRKAVARRRRVAAPVAAELVRCGEECVLKALASNPDAELSRPVMAYLAAESIRFPGIARPLISRTDLPSDLADVLVTWVTEAAIEEAVAAGVSGKTAIEAGRRASERLRQSKADQAKEVLAFQAVSVAAEAGLLSARFVRDSFASGARAAGIAAIARLAKVAVPAARRCVEDARPLAALCRAAEFCHEEFKQVARALHVVTGRHSHAPGADLYERTPVKRARAAVVRDMALVWGEHGFLRAGGW